jgi:hypothetical protein
MAIDYNMLVPAEIDALNEMRINYLANLGVIELIICASVLNKIKEDNNFIIPVVMTTNTPAVAINLGGSYGVLSLKNKDISPDVIKNDSWLLSKF